MTKPHIHAETIKAWADGAIIEAWSEAAQSWVIVATPQWYPALKYRIKPEPKPDIVRYTSVSRVDGHTDITECFIRRRAHCNLRLTFDGDTEQLKAVELIK